jgi:ribosomal protein S18 acetylase RimI-like enzyme
MDEAELRARAWRGVARQQQLFAEHVPGARSVAGDGWTGSLVPTASDSALLNVAVPDHPATVPGLLDLQEVFGDSAVRWGLWTDGSVASDGHLMLAGMQTVTVCRLMARELTYLSAQPSAAEPTDDLRFVGALNDRAYGLTDGRLETHFGVIAPGAVHAHRIGEKAVAAAVDNADDASLFFVATAPEARGKGLGTEVVIAALVAARDRGCVTATLLATGEGSGLYDRLGFADLGPATLWATRA